MREESRMKAMLENRLEEAESNAQLHESEVNSLRQQLAEEQAKRKAAEEEVASLKSEVSAAKASAVDASAHAVEVAQSAAHAAEVAKLKTQLEAMGGRHEEELRCVPHCGYLLSLSARLSAVH